MSRHAGPHPLHGNRSPLLLSPPSLPRDHTSYQCMSQTTARSCCRSSLQGTAPLHRQCSTTRRGRQQCRFAVSGPRPWGSSSCPRRQRMVTTTPQDCSPSSQHKRDKHDHMNRMAPDATPAASLLQSPRQVRVQGCSGSDDYNCVVIGSPVARSGPTRIGRVAGGAGGAIVPRRALRLHTSDTVRSRGTLQLRRGCGRVDTTAGVVTRRHNRRPTRANGAVHRRVAAHRHGWARAAGWAVEPRGALSYNVAKNTNTRR